MLLPLIGIVFITVLPESVLGAPHQPFCLDDCVCDQEDKVIRCDHGERTKIAIPDTPLEGYNFIAFTCNRLSKLPDEAILKAAFPDIQGIDVQGNPTFNCSSGNLKEIPVLSDCGSEKSLTECTVEDRHCDWKCKTLKRLRELWRALKATLKEKYVEYGGDRIQEILIQKYKDVGGDKVVDSIGDWFSSAYKTIAGKDD